MLTDVIAPEVLERDVSVPAAEQVEILPMQDAGVLASRSGNPIVKADCDFCLEVILFSHKISNTKQRDPK